MSAPVPSTAPPVAGQRAQRKARREAANQLETTRPYQPKRQRRSIRLDKVHPADMNNYDVRFFCDQCSHYSRTEERCTIGFVAQHTKEKQMAIYNLMGAIAFCRFMEID